MASRRKTAPRGRKTSTRSKRGVLLRVGLGVLVAGILFGGGIGVGAWIAAGSGSPEPAASRASVSAPQPVPRAVAPVQSADIPLPKMAKAVAAAKAREVAAATIVPSTAAPEPMAAQPPSPGPLPAWQAFAVATSVPQGAPMIALVLDDLGLDTRRSNRAVALPAQLTLAYLPYADGLEAQTAEARRRGHELLAHIPMQPHGLESDPGPNVLDMRLGAIEVLSRLDWNLDRFSGYVGINNHMGSLFTESEEGMRLVAEGLRDRGLLFLDSLTSPKSVAASTAASLGVPTTTRDVFLDNTDTAAEVELRLEQTERVARKTGTAIAIGHPRDATLNVLEAWIPRARAAGFALVPLTAILKARRGAAEQQASRP